MRKDPSYAIHVNSARGGVWEGVREGYTFLLGDWFGGFWRFDGLVLVHEASTRLEARGLGGLILRYYYFIILFMYS